METKRCSRCRKKKPVTQFHKGRDAKGCHPYCKECSKEYAKERYLSRKERQQRHANDMFRCSRCGKNKKASSFYAGQRRCASCTKQAAKESYGNLDKEKQAARIRRWNERNPEKRKEIKRRWSRKNRRAVASHKLKNTYGITIDDYERMLEEQGHRCKICGRKWDNKVEPMKKPCIDHCHETGVVRGLLCRSCNYGLGFFGDSTEALKSAIRYLEK